MSNIDAVNSAFYLNSTIEATKTEAKRQEKERRIKNGDVKKTFFSSLMEETDKLEANEQNFVSEIEGMTFEQAESFLIDEVNVAGDALKKQPVQENFLKYKNAVGNFLKFVQNQCYEVEDLTGIRPQKKPGKAIRKGKKYKLVKIVNEKLDKLASDILYNQKDQIKMASRINEISGLLIDVFF